MEIEEKREEVKVEKEMPTSTGDCYTRYLNGYKFTGNTQYR